MLIERQIAKTVTVVGEKFFFPFQIFLGRLQTHSDVGINASISECDAPVMNIAIHRSMFLPPCDRTKSLEAHSL